MEKKKGSLKYKDMLRVKSQFEIKDLDEKKGILICYPSIYGVIDSDKDMVMPGAFTKTISEWGPSSPKPRIKHLWQHDRYQLIGRPELMKEDGKGLYVESLFGKDQFSQEKLQQHIDGIITEMSFGYEIVKAEKSATREGQEYQRLTELKMWEYSSVTWGANMMTEAFSGVKTEDKKTALDLLNTRMDKFIKALRNPKYTDDTLESFELEIKQIQAIINELLLKQEPVKTTPEPTDEVTLIRDFRQMLNFLNQ